MFSESYFKMPCLTLGSGSVEVLDLILNPRGIPLGEADPNSSFIITSLLYDPKVLVVPDEVRPDDLILAASLSPKEAS